MNINNIKVLVYQMGKVGSVSVVKAVRKLGFEAYHIHYIYTDGEFPSDGKKILRKLAEGMGYKIIVLVRDPVARNISAAFQNFGKMKCETYEDVYDVLLEAQDNGDLWFEKEFKGLIGLDLLAQPFDIEKGYSIYQHDQHEILVMRLEDAERCFSEASEKLLGIPAKMRHEHQTIDRFKRGPQYAAMYEKMRSEPLPEEYIDRVHNQKYAQHYYTPSELDQFKRAWLNGM